jgi:hypothetical protein
MALQEISAAAVTTPTISPMYVTFYKQLFVTLGARIE